MQFNVPQFINMEDRIVGPLTAKQLGWLALGGVILLVLWNFLNLASFIIAAIFVVLVFGALAFLKPHGMPLFHFILSSFFFMSRPKVYTWKRTLKKTKLEKIPQKAKKQKNVRKKIKQKDIKNISKILDK